MDEHRETPTPYFSEKTDSTSASTTTTTLDSHHLNVLDTTVPDHTGPQSHRDTIATVILNPAVSIYTPTEPSILLYNSNTSTRILVMANTEDDDHSLPFLQRVQLTGPGDYMVRATGQVDDGAMCNCISKRCWEHYGHCLTLLEPLTTRIKVANGSKITPLGCWTGTVTVGKVGTPSSFEVFDCGDTFDVILGKPWLKAVKATHDYSTDEITISHNGESDIILNAVIHPTTDHTQISSDHVDETPSKTPATIVDTIAESDPMEQLDKEWARIHQLQASKYPWKETCWARYLSIDPMDTDEEDPINPIHGKHHHANPPFYKREATTRRRDAAPTQRGRRRSTTHPCNCRS